MTAPPYCHGAVHSCHVFERPAASIASAGSPLTPPRCQRGSVATARRDDTRRQSHWRAAARRGSTSARLTRSDLTCSARAGRVSSWLSACVGSPYTLALLRRLGTTGLHRDRRRLERCLLHRASVLAFSRVSVFFPCVFLTRPLRSTAACDVCLSADSVAVRCIPARAQTLSAIQGDSCLPRVHCALRGDVGGAGASRRSRSDLTASTNRVASVRSPDHGPTDSARPSAVSPQPAMSAAMPAPINHVLTLDDRLVFPFSPSLAIGPWYLGA